MVYLTHNLENKEGYTFSKDISRKVNSRAWLEFELAYYDVPIKHVNHYVTCIGPYDLGRVGF